MAEEKTNQDIALKELDTLRQETLQSQNQRFTSFQISISIFTILYSAYLLPASKLRLEPIIFQSFLLLFLIPFIRIVGALRLRDYYQACYIGDFVRFQVPQLRYTQRNNLFDKSLRAKTSSTDAIRYAYYVMGLLTIPLTFGYAYISWESSSRWYMKLGIQKVWPDLIVRLFIFIISLTAFIETSRRAGVDKKLRKEIFKEFRRISILELLSAKLTPAQCNPSDFDRPETWENLFNGESEGNKKIVLECLRELGSKNPIALRISNHLESKWRG